MVFVHGFGHREFMSKEYNTTSFPGLVSIFSYIQIQLIPSPIYLLYWPIVKLRIHFSFDHLVTISRGCNPKLLDKISYYLSFHVITRNHLLCLTYSLMNLVHLVSFQLYKGHLFIRLYFSDLCILFP